MIHVFELLFWLVVELVIIFNFLIYWSIAQVAVVMEFCCIWSSWIYSCFYWTLMSYSSCETVTTHAQKTDKHIVHVFLHTGLFSFYCTSNHSPKAEYVMSWHIFENIITSVSILTASRHIWMELPQRLTHKLFKKTLQSGSQSLSIPWGNLPVKMFTGYSPGLMCFSIDSFFLQITKIHLNPSDWFSSHFDFITLVSHFQISTDFMYSAHACHSFSVFDTHITPCGGEY